MWSRIYLIPALTAEEDRDLARRYYADQAREKQLLGGNTSPYNSDKYAYLEQAHWNGGQNADLRIDTFAQLSRLPRESAPNKGRIVLVAKRGSRALYICKGRRKQSDYQKPPISSSWCHKPINIVFDGCQVPSLKVVRMRLFLRAISRASTTFTGGHQMSHLWSDQLRPSFSRKRATSK